nr:ASN_HP1_G0005010.mRNA.1.CDS.1 [Saccharomyces cerevisiae]
MRLSVSSPNKERSQDTRTLICDTEHTTKTWILFPRGTIKLKTDLENRGHGHRDNPYQMANKNISNLCFKPNALKKIQEYHKNWELAQMIMTSKFDPKSTETLCKKLWNHKGPQHCIYNGQNTYHD